LAGGVALGLRKLFADDPLSRAALQVREWAGRDRFRKLVPKLSNQWAGALGRFTGAGPFAFWDDESVKCAVAVLEENPTRTCNAIRERGHLFDLGLSNLLVLSEADLRQKPLPMGDGRKTVELATVFHPEYLRKSEHVFGNLLSVYWSVRKRGDVSGNYVVKNAVALFDGCAEAVLVRGYVDEIRNSIAHGEVCFTATGTRYGSHARSPVLLPDEFLASFDHLWRSSLALALGVLLFLARNDGVLAGANVSTPASVCGILASGAAERPGFRVTGAFASEVPRIGRQLNVVTENSFKARAMVILDALRLARRLQEAGATGFSRFLIESHHPWGTPSMVSVSPSRLQRLIDQDASTDRLMESLADTPMVWEDESQLITRCKAYPLIARTQLRAALMSVRRSFRSVRALRVVVKSIRNASVRPTSRVEVVLVLEEADRDVTPEEVDALLVSFCRRYSRQLVKDNPGRFTTRRCRKRFPSYVWIRLYRRNGTLRWLGRDSVKEGNLLAAAERIRGKDHKPVLVRDPEKIVSGVRIRYSYDPRGDTTLEEIVGKAIVGQRSP
jgi:hypothetical protein